MNARISSHAGTCKTKPLTPARTGGRRPPAASARFALRAREGFVGELAQVRCEALRRGRLTIGQPVDANDWMTLMAGCGNPSESVRAKCAELIIRLGHARR
jgi:hypothetical protein